MKKENYECICLPVLKPYCSEPREEVWAQLGELLKILCENGQTCRVYYDGCTIIVDHNYSDPSMAGVELLFVSEDDLNGT